MDSASRNHCNRGLTMSNFIKFASVLCMLITSQLSVVTCGRLANDERLLSDVTLQHFYVMEESILTHAEILFREEYLELNEDEDNDRLPIMNWAQLTSLFNTTKAMHREAGPKLSSFLSQPINVYHLFRRLDSDWRTALDLLLGHLPDKSWQVPIVFRQLQDMKTDLPGSEEVDRVVSLTDFLYRVIGGANSDVTQGHRSGDFSLDSLSLQDQFDIAKVLHDKEDMTSSLTWLQTLHETLTNDQKSQIRGQSKSQTKGNTKMQPTQTKGKTENAINFKLSDVWNMMASAYYHLKRPDLAYDWTKRVLEQDPQNAIAQGNLAYFKAKMEQRKTDQDKEKDVPLLRSSYERLCAGITKKLKRLSCRYIVGEGLTIHKVETLKKKPLVLLYHDVIGVNTADRVKNYTYTQQSDLAWQSEDTFNIPALSFSLALSKIKNDEVQREVTKMTRKIRRLASLNSNRKQRFANLQVVNIGLDGAKMESYRQRLSLSSTRKIETAAFFIFLNEIRHGGHVVFPKYGLTFKAPKGSVLYYQTARARVHQHCPSLGSSAWIAVQTVFQGKEGFCTDEDE